MIIGQDWLVGALLGTGMAIMTGDVSGRRWKKSWIFSMESDSLKTDLKNWQMRATEILELVWSTKGLFQEAELLSCMPEGLRNLRGSCNGPGMTSGSTKIISIIFYCSYLTKSTWLDFNVKVSFSTSPAKSPKNHPPCFLPPVDDDSLFSTTFILMITSVKRHKWS